MKKKKWLLVSLIFLGCIFIFAFTMILSGKRNTVEKLISQLENAINEHDIEKIIDLYPDYCRADVVKYFSQEKLNEFYNNVIAHDNKDIQIQILNVSNYDVSSCNDVMKQIAEDYQEGIWVEDYQIVQVKYHDDFGESIMQVIKIDSKYYLYFNGDIGEPISYFH